MKKIEVAYRDCRYGGQESVFYCPDMSKELAKDVVDMYECRKTGKNSPFVEAFDLSDKKVFSEWVSRLEQYGTDNRYLLLFSKIEQKGFIMVLNEPAPV